MLEGIYLVIAISIFFAQLKNGFFTALFTVMFWPVWAVGGSIFIFFSTLYHTVKKGELFLDCYA